MANQPKTAPLYITQLLERCRGNATQAAELMGSAPSTVNRAMQFQETSRKQELRAKAALEELDAREQAQSEPVQFLVTVPAEKHQSFEKVAAALGCEAVAL